MMDVRTTCGPAGRAPDDAALVWDDDDVDFRPSFSHLYL